MPFCRECGKEVQADWVTCPYCSQAIGPPNSMVNMQDSFAQIDIQTYNDPNSISTAVQTATACSCCQSTGTTQYACISCKKIAFCSVCKTDEMKMRNDAMVSYVELLNLHKPIYDELVKERLCRMCYEDKLSSLFPFICPSENCNAIYPDRTYLIACFACEFGFCALCSPDYAAVDKIFYCFDNETIRNGLKEEHTIEKDLQILNKFDWGDSDEIYRAICRTHVQLIWRPEYSGGGGRTPVELRNSVANYRKHGMLNSLHKTKIMWEWCDDITEGE